MSMRRSQLVGAVSVEVDVFVGEEGSTVVDVASSVPVVLVDAVAEVPPAEAVVIVDSVPVDSVVLVDVERRVAPVRSAPGVALDHDFFEPTASATASTPLPPSEAGIAPPPQAASISDAINDPMITRERPRDCVTGSFMTTPNAGSDRSWLVVACVE
jgi:hypothetical protein